MLHWLLPLGSLQREEEILQCDFTPMTVQLEIRQEHGDGFYRDEKWMICELVLFKPDFLFVWVCYPTADKKSQAGPQEPRAVLE